MLTHTHKKKTLEKDPSEEGATDSEVKVQVGRKMGQQIVLRNNQPGNQVMGLRFGPSFNSRSK